MHDCPYGLVVPKTNSQPWQAKRRANVNRDQLWLLWWNQAVDLDHMGVHDKAERDRASAVRCEGLPRLARNSLDPKVWFSSLQCLSSVAFIHDYLNDAYKILAGSLGF
jgi:hypothetical protein